MKRCRTIVCMGIKERISAYIAVTIKEHIDRGIIIAVAWEEVVRETPDCIKEASVDGIGIGRKIERIGTVIGDRVTCPKRFNGLLLSPSNLCSGKKMEI